MVLKATDESTAPVLGHDAIGAPPVGTFVTASAAQSDAVIAASAADEPLDVKETFCRV
jgi:hypothetical protein